MPVSARAAEAAAGARALADFVESHPDLPVDPAPDPFNVHVLHGTDDGKRDEVDRVAAILGVAAHLSGPGTNYSARRDFGPVSYRITAVFAGEADRCMRYLAPYVDELHERAAARRAEAAA